MSGRDRWLGFTARYLRDRRDANDPTAALLLACLISADAITAESDNEKLDALRIAAKQNSLAGYAYAREKLIQQGSRALDPPSSLLQLLKGASSDGIAMASTLLGLLFDSGLVGKPDRDMARRFYELGGNQGDAKAWGLLGIMLFVDDRGEISQPDEAEQYFQKAVLGGDWSVASHLAKLHLQSKMPKRVQTGLALLHQGADHEDFGCLLRLALVYSHGEFGVQSDLKAAQALRDRALAAQSRSNAVPW